MEKSKKIRKVEKLLYKMANNLVGCVGEQGKTAKAIINEPYITVVIPIDMSAKYWDNTLSAEWIYWVKGYFKYAKFMKPEGREILRRNQEMVIYWRERPVVEEDGGEYYVYARLLISPYKTVQ